MGTVSRIFGKNCRCIPGCFGLKLQGVSLGSQPFNLVTRVGQVQNADQMNSFTYRELNGYYCELCG